jgi:hypothetical protein
LIPNGRREKTRVGRFGARCSAFFTEDARERGG